MTDLEWVDKEIEFNDKFIEKFGDVKTPDLDVRDNHNHLLSIKEKLEVLEIIKSFLRESECEWSPGEIEKYYYCEIGGEDYKKIKEALKSEV